MSSEQGYRSLDGFGNNVENPYWGAANTPLRRVTRVAYGDGLSSPAGANRPNPRDISNLVLDQSKSVVNPFGASDYLWIWGQWVDHDIGFTPARTNEYLDIQIPQGDAWFDPSHIGQVVIPFKRAVYTVGTDGIRQQINLQSSFIDASNVYGASEERANALRTLDGTGKLKTGPDGLLPFNLDRLSNDPNNNASFYLAGDERANEQPTLTAMHSLWLREHNRLAHQYYHEDPSQTGETIYQRARQMVIALNQAITFNEFLPVLLGSSGVSSYSGYNPNVDPSVVNIFSTACYRLGHSLVSPELLRLSADGTAITEGPLKLRDGFFSPSKLTEGGGMEPLLRGAAKQACQKLDARSGSELRNFLFGNPGQGGMDLGSLNIQRGRDHGLPSYNDAREDLGLARKQSFEEISSDLETVNRLKQAYSSVDDIDIWVGGLSENNYHNSMVGELFFVVVKAQFEILRDGDRFWYQNVFSGADLTEIDNTLLSDVIRRNTLIGSELQNDVFKV